MRHEDHVSRYGLTGNQRVIRTDHNSPRREKRPDRSGLTSILTIKFNHRKLQGIDESDVVGRTPALECAVRQFVRDNRGNGDVADPLLPRTQSRPRGGIPQHRDHHIRVEQVAHQRNNLSSAGRSCCDGSSSVACRKS